MEKNEIAPSAEEVKFRDSFRWNFLLLILLCVGSVALFLSAILSFVFWLYGKTCKIVLKKLSSLVFMNYEVVTEISQEYKILKNKKNGRYGVCKNLHFIFPPRYEEIVMTPSYDLLIKPANNSSSFQVSFFVLQRDVA